MNIGFKKSELDKAQPTSKRYFISDTKIPFLRLVVHPSGSKIFVLNRRLGDKVYILKIGRYDCLTIEQARNKAKSLNIEFDLGRNPHEEKKKLRNALTFGQLYEHYFSGYAISSTKRPDQNRKTIELHVLPKFGKMLAMDITNQDMRRFHTQLGETISRYSKPDAPKKSYSNAKRILNLVSAVFNYGIENNLISCTNPCEGIKKASYVSRDRFILINEIKSFMDALKEEKMIFSDFFKTLLYTGARKGNVLSMEESTIDFDLKRWRLSEKLTKNRDVNIVLLSDPALRILTVRSAFNEFRKTPSRYVFESEWCDGHLKDPKKAWSRIKQFMGVGDLRIHDLRRTLGSYMAINNSSLPIIGKALNHKSQASTAIYARLSNDPVLEAINGAAQLILSHSALK